MITLYKFLKYEFLTLHSQFNDMIINTYKNHIIYVKCDIIFHISFVKISHSNYEFSSHECEYFISI